MGTTEETAADTRSERDLIHADLGQLLEMLGLGDHARPESSHEVFQQCLAELARMLNGAQQLGKVVSWQAQSMRAARIEMIQNGPEKAVQWILNSIPDVDDNDPEDQWNGTETATEWLERLERTADACRVTSPADVPAAAPCCTGCGPDCGCGGTPHEAPEAGR